MKSIFALLAGWSCWHLTGRRSGLDCCAPGCGIATDRQPEREPQTTNGVVIRKNPGNGATNIVPDEVTLAGTFRALNESWRQEGLSRIQHLAEGLAASMEVA